MYIYGSPLLHKTGSINPHKFPYLGIGIKENQADYRFRNSYIFFFKKMFFISDTFTGFIQILYKNCQR